MDSTSADKCKMVEKKARPSPLCIICQENLVSQSCHTMKSESDSNSIQPIVLAINCGHLFHTECLNKWFKTHQNKLMKQCPCCRREMMANDTRRVFFSLDSEE